MERRPKFFTTFCNNLGRSFERRGGLALIPWWLLTGVFFGVLVARFMPPEFWSDSKWGVATTVYTGFLAFDGLLLALGWGAFSRIYEVLSTGRFAAFLRRNDLLDDHLFFVAAVHGVLVLSALSSGCALVTVLLPLPLRADQVILVIVIAFSFWSLIKALSAMQMMNDLVWELAHTKEDDRGHIRPIDLKQNNGDGA